ncbi:hypothetical protein BBJ28_00006584 [Nothophytophthora sp. Chile5]|nr:hypothetical protein BBJ28_00006584 [Nothophytophthora sp. Chile5]
MAALTLELYERILALVAPRELRVSCNGVLGDEISDVEHAVDDMVAAFARLEEVRDAVAKLEHDKAPVGRSAGLLAVMDSTIDQQRDLEASLRKITGERAVVHEKKAAVEMEKPSDDGNDGIENGGGRSSNESSSSSSGASTESESEGEEPAQVKAKKPKSSEPDQTSEGHEGGSSELQLAHKCLHSISLVVVNNKMIAQRKRGWTPTLLELKRFIERQSRCSDSAVDAPAVEVAARALLGVVEILGRVTWTPKLLKEMQTLLATLKSACANNEMSVPKSMPAATESSQPVPQPLDKSGKQLKYYELMLQVAFLSFEERTQRIPTALPVLQKAMADDGKGEGVVRILKSVRRVTNWVREVPRRDQFREKYRSFATSVEAYGQKIPNGEMGADLLRYGGAVCPRQATNVCLTFVCLWSASVGRRSAAEIRKVVNAGTAASGRAAERLATEQGKRKQTSSPTVKAASSKHRLSDETAAMKELVVSSLAQVNEWQDGVFAVGQVDKVMKQLDSAVYYVMTDWDPRTDSTLRECLDKLAACIQHIKKQALRDKRAATVKKWRAALGH